MAYLIYQEEEAPDTKKHHLQGYVQFKKKCRMKKAKDWLGGNMRVHLEPMKGKPSEAAAYCKKEESRVEGGLKKEEGHLAPRAGNGTRTDLISLMDELKAGKKPIDLRWDPDYTEASAKYQRHIDTMFSDLQEKKARLDLAAEAEQLVLRPWQEYVASLMQNDPDDRTIYWLYDFKGGAGKTVLANYLVGNDHALVLTPARVADMAYIWSQQYTNTNIVVFDCCRSFAKELGQRDPLQGSLELAEAIKNRRVTSTKYVSKICHSAACHVLFMANRLPDYSKLSEDRWHIMEVKDGELTHYKVEKELLIQTDAPALQ